jgi:hypothetical protein
MELTFIENLRKRLSFDRLSRLRQHYVAITDELKPKTPQEREEVRFFKARFEHYGKIVEHLWRIKVFFYVVLYATIFVGVIHVMSQFLPFLSVVTAFIKFASVLFGPVAFIAVLYLTAKINLNLELMQDCMTHLINIYHKNPKRDSKTAIAKIAKAI